MSKLSLGVQRAGLIRMPDSIIALRTEIRVPDTEAELTASMNALGGAINAGGWATAAVVHTWTQPQQGKRTSITSDGGESIQAFAARGLRGLSSINTVRTDRAAWERAVERGWAQPAVRGQVVTLPTQDFRETEAHVGANTGDSEWFTPREIIVAARRVMGAVDLDPASTAEANEVVGATVFYTKARTGSTTRGAAGCS